MSQNAQRVRRSQQIVTNRQVQRKVPGEEYAKVLQRLGGCRYNLLLYNGQTCLGILRGSMKKKKVRVNVFDIVLVGLREFQKDRVDVLYRYTNDEVRVLVSQLELEDNFVEGSDTLPTKFATTNEFESFELASSRSHPVEPIVEPTESFLPPQGNESDSDDELGLAMTRNPNRPCQ